jgi:predicted nucleic acid-binding protein
MKDIDPDDSPFLALAMMLNAPIWSNDSHFKKQKAAPIFTTKEILPLLGIDHNNLKSQRPSVARLVNCSSFAGPLEAR